MQVSLLALAVVLFHRSADNAKDLRVHAAICRPLTQRALYHEASHLHHNRFEHFCHGYRLFAAFVRKPPARRQMVPATTDDSYIRPVIVSSLHSVH